jgi:hypothetical protein
MNPEVMAGIFGLGLIALTAIMFFIKRFISRRQERISVRPHLIITREILDDRPIQIRLINDGVGPAYIDNFQIQIDSGSDSYDFLSSIKKIGLSGTDVIYYSPNKDEELPLNETRVLFEANPINNIDREKICSAVSRLSFIIGYNSMYDDKFQIRG